ncbi:MAG: hypothetical protein J6P60_00860 [Lachnospiraceae bacterium]|nr:hypothetical protein [Lachnospiraceae bacterium]
MKQVWRELKAENGIVLLSSKLVMLSFFLFGGVLLRGFPYMVMIASLPIAFFVIPMLRGEIQLLLPRTERERCRTAIVKCMVKAAVYSLCVAAGYVINISFSGRYHWDRQMIAFVGIMEVFLFLGYFNYALSAEQIGNRPFVFSERETKREIAMALVPLLAFVYLWILTLQEMSGLDWFDFGRSQNAVDLAGAALLLITLCLVTRKQLKRLDQTEYQS